MAFSRKATRASSLVQLLLGVLCLILGLADRTEDTPRIFTVELSLGIWCGIWICAAGAIGCTASRCRHENTPKIVLIAVYMGFSVTSTILAIVLLSCYGYAMAQLVNRSPCFAHINLLSEPTDMLLEPVTSHPTAVQCKAKLSLVALIIALAIAEIGTSLWAAVCCFKAGKCCDPLNIETVPDKIDQIVYHRMDHEEDLLLAADDGETMV